MTFPTATFASYEAIGNREDLSDVIYRIDPTEVPFQSGIERETATSTKHEWQTQGLAAAALNAQLEGDDVVADVATATKRIFNYCQISRKTARVTGTQRVTNHAGRGDEMTYQETLKGLELKRDMEFALLQNTAQAIGSDSLARKTASVLSYIKTNTNKTGTDPATNTGSGTRTDGTQQAFTEPNLKAVLSAAWLAGGKPDTIMVGPFNKQVFSTFTGRATAMEQAATKKITASVVIYESDFGTLTIVPNRFMRATTAGQPGREALVLQMDMWALAFLNGRKMVSFPIAKTGDSDAKTILSEYCLVSRNEASSGIVADLTTA